MPIIKFGNMVTKKRLKILLPLLIVAALAAAAVIFVKNMNGPAQGAIAQQPPSQTKITPPAAPVKYNDQFISFVHPAIYAVVPSQKSTGYLDIVSLHNTDHSGKYVEIGLQREDLQYDPGYNHRKGNTGIYKQLPSTAASAVFTSSQNGSEQTGFITHGAYVLSISITASGSVDLSQDYNVIAGSLQWKE